MVVVENKRLNLPTQNTIKTLRFVTILANCFGLFPVQHKGSKCAKFKWTSWWMVYAVSVFILSTTQVLTASLNIFKGPTFAEFVQFMFFFNWVATVHVFFHLAGNWPELMEEWCKVDKATKKNYGYPKGLDKKLKVITLVIMLLALLEYLLSIISHITDCVSEYGILEASTYYPHVFPNIFYAVGYNPYLACGMQITSFLANFTWNFADVLVILLSTILATRFKQINDRLRENETKTTLYEKSFWIEIREDYNRLAILCKHLDSTLCYVVLAAFASDLFFVLVQIYNSLNIDENIAEQIYFFYSFCFLVFRTVAVLLYTAKINDESKQPKEILNALPSNVYNDEVQRFQLQLSLNDVALTGNKMFKITRGLLLDMAGAVVTYELALISFSKLNE